jgi:hypothetical protein
MGSDCSSTVTDYLLHTVACLAAASFKRSFSALTSTKVLQLSGKPGIQLLGTPTRSSYESLSNRVMVVQSDLQYACECVLEQQLAAAAGLIACCWATSW